jgi:Fic family protein
MLHNQNMANAYRWRPITDLPNDPRALTDGEMDSLYRVWQNQKNDLSERTALDEFDKRLRREWAIETGIIEDVYTLDRGVTRTLIEKGIEAALIPHDATNRDTTLVARIIQDHYDALEGMFDFVGGTRRLSTSYINELHAALLRNVEVHTVEDQFGQLFPKRLEKGVYKTAPNSPTRLDGSVHEYCPPEHVASEMDELLRMYAEHEARNVPPEVEAAWLHHRFTQIHPFADGNGRVARAIASIVFIRAGWFPLIVKRDDKPRYIEALEKADEGDLRPLVDLFVEGQRSALIQATEIAHDVRPIASTHEAVIAARDRLLQRGKLPLKEWLAAKETATKLVAFAAQQLGKTATELTNEIGSLRSGFGFGASGGPQGGYDNIRATAVQKAGYAANFNDYNATANLSLNAGRPDSLTLSFHGIGPRYRGLIGVVAYLVIQGAEPKPIEGGTFQINYEEEFSSAQTRFSAWLDRVVIEGLNAWRRTL